MGHAEAEHAPQTRGKAFARTGLAAAAVSVLLILAGAHAAAASTLSGHPGQTQQAQTQQSPQTQSPQTQTSQTQTPQAQSTATDSVPTPPGEVSAIAGDGRVTLSWSTASRATSYAVFAGTGVSFTASTRELTVSVTGGTVTGLTNGTTYYFWVIAVNSAGKSVESGVVKATPMAPATVPGAPAGLTAVSKDDGATLTWDAPASDGGSPVTGYDVYAATSPDFRGGLPAVKVTGTSYALSGRTKGDTWYFKVAAINARGVGPASAVVSAFATPATPAKPAKPAQPAKPAKPAQPAQPAKPATPVTLGRPTSVTAAVGPGRATLWWTAPDAARTTISGYFVFVGTRPGGESATPAGNFLVHGTSVVLAGLSGGTRYYFTVAAVGPDGRRGTQSAEVTAVPPVLVATRQTTGTSQPTGIGQTTDTGQVASIDQGTGTPVVGIQVADRDGSTDTGSPSAAVNHRPPHAAAIIVLSGVATAALAGAVGGVLHLRRRGRLSASPAGRPDRKAVDSMTGHR